MKEIEKKLFLTFFEEDVLFPVKCVIGSGELSRSGDHSKIQLGSVITSCDTNGDLEVDIDLEPVFTYGEKMLVSKTHLGKEYQKLWCLSHPSVQREQAKY